MVDVLPAALAVAAEAAVLVAADAPAAWADEAADNLLISKKGRETVLFSLDFDAKRPPEWAAFVVLGIY